MKTNNIISTPDITGNISSCKTETQQITSGRENWYTINYTTIATNNCTGSVEKYDTYGYSPALVFVSIFVLTISLMILGLIKVWLTPSQNRNPYNFY